MSKYFETFPALIIITPKRCAMEWTNVVKNLGSENVIFAECVKPDFYCNSFTDQIETELLLKVTEIQQLNLDMINTGIFEISVVFVVSFLWIYNLYFTLACIALSVNSTKKGSGIVQIAQQQNSLAKPGLFLDLMCLVLFKGLHFPFVSREKIYRVSFDSWSFEINLGVFELITLIALEEIVIKLFNEL